MIQSRNLKPQRRPWFQPPSPVPISSDTLISQLQLPVLALGVQTGDLDIDRDLALHAPHILVAQTLNAVIRDPDRQPDSIPFVGTEAIFLHDTLDEFLNGEISEEDGPVVDFGLGGTDIDTQSWVGEREKVSNDLRGRVTR